MEFLSVAMIAVDHPQRLKRITVIATGVTCMKVSWHVCTCMQGCRTGMAVLQR